MTKKIQLTFGGQMAKVLHYADSHGLLNPGQFGGQHGCEAQSLAFLEELKYDISYCSRCTLLTFDNDAMSCYDRIVLALASLINLKYRQNRKAVLVQVWLQLQNQLGHPVRPNSFRRRRLYPPGTLFKVKARWSSSSNTGVPIH
jgi:hypothetical protein